MAVVTEAFDIPMDIMTKLATGEYRRLGGVVRVAIGPNKGQIVKHLDPIKIEQVAQNKNVVTKVIEFSKKNRKVIIIGTAVAGTIVAGNFVHQKIKNREPKVMKRYHAALRSYIEDIRNGELSMKSINRLMDALEELKQDKRYEMFDNNIEIDLIKKVINYNPKWLMYTPDRLDIEKLCINLMEKDFCIARYMPLQVKMSETILKYQKSKNKLRFVNKYYDCDEKKFIIDAEIIYNQVGEFEYKYNVQKYFEDFFEFYNFLDGNLADAELWDYDFQGIDLKKYNIEGATISSDILEAQGLYDGSYFSTIKKF